MKAMMEPLFDRTIAYYEGGYIGENVAWGYQDERAAVLNGWMCSTTGHRENLMHGGFNELGTGVVGVYYTQDFGGRDMSHRLISMGVHAPESPSSTVVFSADYYDEAGRAPDTFGVLVDGMLHPLELEYGTDTQGIWSVQLDTDSETCHSYVFVAEVDGEQQTFPEAGSYGYGPCEFDNATSRWLDRQEEVQGCGCNVAGAPGWLALTPLMLLATRRRRLGPDFARIGARCLGELVIRRLDLTNDHLLNLTPDKANLDVDIASNLKAATRSVRKYLHDAPSA